MGVATPGGLLGEVMHDLPADDPHYLEAVERVLSRILPADVILLNDIDVDQRQAHVAGSRSASWEPETLADVAARDHPMVRSYLRPGDIPRPRRISDVMSQREFRRTATYAELFRPQGLRFQMTVLTVGPGPVGQRRGRGWVLNRASGDFTDDEVALAADLRGMLSLLDQARLSRRVHATRTCEDRAAKTGAGLTPREVEVLRLVAQGYTAARIGRALAISSGTVRKHLENAYRKLGHGDRLLAVQRAEALGLL